MRLQRASITNKLAAILENTEPGKISDFEILVMYWYMWDEMPKYFLNPNQILEWGWLHATSPSSILRTVSIYYSHRER